MTATSTLNIDPKLDLVLERTIDVPPHLVFKAWTTPEHLVHWFCPKPWTTTRCEIDLHPGGKFNTVMRSPEGEEFPNEGCFLEIVENRKLVWTDALKENFRPTEKPFMSAVLLLEPHGANGTKYTAIAIHRDEATAQQHVEMGFHGGWGTVVDQMVDYLKSLS